MADDAFEATWQHLNAEVLAEMTAQSGTQLSGAAQAARHAAEQRRHRARDDRSLPRSSRSASAAAHAGIAQPVPTDTRCGAAASIDERGRSTAKRRPVGRRLPMLSIANPAASPRRTCEPFRRVGSATSRVPQAAPGVPVQGTGAP